MLFMNLYSWDNEKRDEVITRRVEKGTMAPEGVKILGEWTAVGRNLGVLICECDDPTQLSQFNLAWSDILKSDIMLVLDTEKDLIDLLKG